MSSSCLLPFWVPRRQRHFISVFLKVTFAPAHTFCKYRARFHNGQGGGTAKSMSSATPGELLLIQHYIEIHSLGVLTNQTMHKFFSAFRCYVPIWTSCIPAGKSNQVLFMIRFEPFSWTLCVCVKVFSCFFLPLPFNNVLLVTAQIWCFHWDYTACPEVQKFNLSNGTYKGKKWCNLQVQVGAPEILGMHKLRPVLERTGPTLTVAVHLHTLTGFWQ